MHEINEDYKSLYEESIKQNVILCGQIVTIKQKARLRISMMKADVDHELRAVEIVLGAIRDSQSSHWQKKENIRLALEILQKLPTFDKGQFFTYEDDF